MLRTENVLLNEEEKIAIDKITSVLLWKDFVIFHRGFIEECRKGFTEEESKYLMSLALNMDKYKYKIQLEDGRLLVPYKTGYNGRMPVCGLMIGKDNSNPCIFKTDLQIALCKERIKTEFGRKCRNRKHNGEMYICKSEKVREYSKRYKNEE
jgi:hypothetical protein